MTVPDFHPSHVVPDRGLRTWSAPDPSQPSVPLDPLLPVQVVDRRGDWARVLCSNGWSTWVDGRLLVAVPRRPPAPGRPAARAADPRPLLAGAAEQLDRYWEAAEELAAGRVDREDFRRRVRDLRVGAVVDGESVWLYDDRQERWCYSDGVSLGTFAVTGPPSGGGGGSGSSGGDETVLAAEDAAPRGPAPPGTARDGPGDLG